MQNKACVGNNNSKCYLKDIKKHTIPLKARFCLGQAHYIGTTDLQRTHIDIARILWQNKLLLNEMRHQSLTTKNQDKRTQRQKTPEQY